MIGHLIVASVMPLLFQAPQQSGPSQMTPDQQFQIAMEALRSPAATGPHVILGVLVPFALFAMVFGIFWLRYRQRQAQIRAQADFHKQLLDKFGSGQEFAEFLDGKGSQRFLEELWSQRPGNNERVLGTMRNGVVLTTLGLGMLVLSWTYLEQFRVFGVLALALGVGFLIAAAISHRLSRQWEQRARAETPQVS